MTRWATLLFTSATGLLLVWLLAGCAGYDLAQKGLQAVQEEPLGEASNGKIAFAGYPEGENRSDVYVINPDGTGMRNLTRSTAREEYQPIWSPDGQKIAFLRRDPEDYYKSSIYVMNSDGSGETLLTDDAMPFSELAWSPDGQKIAFSRVDGAGTGELYVINPDGSGQTRLTSSAGNLYVVDMRTPIWSPDSQQIAFSKETVEVTDTDSTVDSTAPAEELSGILVVNADGTGLRKLPGTSQSSYSPTWSPDGQKMAFSEASRFSKATGSLFDIYVMNSDGTGKANLTDSRPHEYNPAWSPDGQKIAFELEDRTGIYISVMNSDGTGRTRLTDTMANEIRPVWSPDGQKIAFETSDNRANIDICVINANGSDRTCLANDVMSSDNRSARSAISWARR